MDGQHDRVSIDRQPVDGDQVGSYADLDTLPNRAGRLSALGAGIDNHDEPPRAATSRHEPPRAATSNAWTQRHPCDVLLVLPVPIARMLRAAGTTCPQRLHPIGSTDRDRPSRCAASPPVTRPASPS